MSDIETDEIDTFSLLKDAAATAVYGAEGANGVILITSKRGKIAKPRISVRGEYNLMQPTRLPDFLGSVEFMDAYNDGLWNEGTPDLWTQEEIQKYALGPNHDNDLYPNVNWLDMLRKNTSSQRYTINFTGGTEKARYFVG
ncbi:MAG: SusC/RagA family TonB-linked outer membrane protein, partial [Mucinivorans sp.]